MELPEMDQRAVNENNINVKVPKRVLHFSDGTLEEFSEDETDEAPLPKEESVVDPKTLSWGPWVMFKAWSAGSSTLAAVDYVGEALASFFGITTPKYQYEIDEFHKLEAERKEFEESRKGWVPADEAGDGFTTQQPSPAQV